MLNLLPLDPDAYDVLARMQTSAHEFKLTGSHLFGGCTRRSDFDFYAQYTPEIHFFLTSIGFDNEPAGYNADPGVVRVLRYFNSVGRSLIDVQLVDDINAKDAIQKVLHSRVHAAPTATDWQRGYQFITAYQNGMEF